MTSARLSPGDHYGLNSSGWPPATVGRDAAGKYYIERLSHDLRRIVREEITEAEAVEWIEAEEQGG